MWYLRIILFSFKSDAFLSCEKKTPRKIEFPISNHSAGVYWFQFKMRGYGYFYTIFFTFHRNVIRLLAQPI